eukprot:CAMPEP_0114550744 /NCGR_PEP_ID=MMETSP0114-20121206/6231_1 /TAXON_ID=31324 /ORGANISM="Goniomonas sp, Strain m" /LENGTH=275 /DNA_ID=CAMNT_0001735527 /DNA_START=20 /DNA_END=847 /DNA_ORIENTATION=-
MEALRSYPGTSLFVYWFCSIVFMDWVNTFAYERVPEPLPPLPDLGFDIIPKATGTFYPADLVTTSVTAVAIVFGLREGLRAHIPNVRLMIMVYAILLNLRTITIIVTTLPICYEHGPCREMHLPLQSRIVTALAYAFALGFGVPGVVQCGDYIFSGHTTYIWLITLHFIRVTKVGRLYQTLLYIWACLGSCAIIAFRRHYTIDVVLGIIVTCFVWDAIFARLELVQLRGPQNLLDHIIAWQAGIESGMKLVSQEDEDEVELGVVKNAAMSPRKTT